MEANELKIGSTYLSVKFNVPVKCELSDLAQLDFLCQGAELDSDIISQVFEPIELTEEWLIKKFSWRKIDKYTFTLNGWFIYKRKRGFVTGSKKREKVLDSVHILQNWWFGNNENELEIK